MRNCAKIFFVVLTALLHLGANSEHKNNALSVNLGTIVIGSYELAYEYKLDKHVSISTLAYYYDSRKVPIRVFSYGYSLGLGFAPKFHVYGKALEQTFYLAPTMKIGFLEHPPRNNDERTTNGILLRIGGIFGFAHVFASGVFLDTNMGLEHYHTFDFKKPSRYQSEKSLLIRPTFSFHLGYAF